MKVENDEGVEIEVYTADEVKAQREEAALAKENEYKPKLTAAEAESQRLDGLLKSRGEEFKQFRKLSDDQIEKLNAAEKTIYENGLLLEEERKKSADQAKATHDSQVDSAIRAKTGADEKLFEKTKAMYGMMGIEAKTPEEIGRKVLASLGALSQTEPDLIASAGFGGGSFEPPKKKGSDETSFADTERGKAAAKELGLDFEEKKK